MFVARVGERGENYSGRVYIIERGLEIEVCVLEVIVAMAAHEGGALYCLRSLSHTSGAGIGGVISSQPWNSGSELATPTTGHRLRASLRKGRVQGAYPDPLLHIWPSYAVCLAVSVHFSASHLTRHIPASCMMR